MDTKLNSGAIFKNTKKPEGSNQPDYRGEIDCDGVKKEIALWYREAASGVKYFSVKLSEPYRKVEEEQPVQAATTDKAAPLAQEFINDLPF